MEYVLNELSLKGQYADGDHFARDGFDYKEFHKNKNTRAYFTPEQWDKGIHKFRISQEIRCFGYRENDRFHLYRIDLDHVLSDKG